MVRFKNRYVLVELEVHDNYMEEEQSEKDIMKAIKGSIQDNFGEFTLAKIVSGLKQIYYNFNSKILIVRCFRDYQKYLRGSQFFLDKINNIILRLRIIKSSGTLKKCEQKVVSYYYYVNQNLSKSLLQNLATIKG